MKPGEFIAARRLAAQASRRGEAFAVIVALSTVFPRGSRGEILAELLAVKHANISTVVRELEQLGILEREWSEPSSEAEHGRTRMLRLSKDWATHWAVAT